MTSPYELDEVAEPARTAMMGLRDDLPPIFGDQLVAIWLYGGQLLPRGSSGDVDGHVVLAWEPTGEQLHRVRALHGAIRADLRIEELDAGPSLGSGRQCGRMAPPVAFRVRNDAANCIPRLDVEHRRGLRCCSHPEAAHPSPGTSTRPSEGFRRRSWSLSDQ